MAALASREGDWSTAPVSPVVGEERLRAEFYLLLAHLLARPPSAELLAHLASLDGDASPLGAALGGLAQAARATTPEAVSTEFDVLFIGLGEGELLPYGSHYLSGFLHDKPLALLRGDLARLEVASAENNPEPEDHVAALCEVMSGLIVGAFGGGPGLDEQRAMFSAHLGNWMPRFFADLETARSADFYKRVGALGRVFIAIEAEAFTLA
ncbi:MAG: molecular chaperone TorD family protein [Alphaproteobacteria bacterium]|nr:molecular chaperone TorD family protein [Alphaproteobacteria bacterium]